jgi:hypothetical protein
LAWTPSASTWLGCATWRQSTSGSRLAELERAYGPIPPETLEWAAQIVERWESTERLAARATKVVVADIV